MDSSERAAPAPPVSLVDDLCDFLENTEEGDVGLLCQFAREFFAKVPRQLLTERSLHDLAAITREAFRFLQRARDDRVSVEVVNPDQEGWDAPVTLIRAEVGDRPFIVDTIREYLSREHLPIQHYVYPVVSLVRRADGSISRVGGPEEANPRALVYCEIQRLPDAERREEIRREIEHRLYDVVAATDDFQAMLGAVEKTVRVVESYRAALPERSAELAEIEDFLRWLTTDNFVFLGYREYDITEEGGTTMLRVERGSGLGILRREEQSAWIAGVPLAEVPAELQRRILDGPLLITSKTNAESTVHRRARMDYIGVKKLSASGEVVGEHRFLGLFTSKAYAEHAEQIPILRRKLQEILRASGANPGSHDYKEIITIFNSMPKEDLFQASPSELEREVQTVLSLLFSDEVQVSLRPDPLARGVSVLVILPRGKFSGEVRERIQKVITRRFAGTILNYHLAMGAGDQARLHFYVSSPREVVEAVDAATVARDIRQLVRSWEDRLVDELARRVGTDEANRVAALYAPAFQDEYRAATLPEVAAQDIEEFERLLAQKETVAITLREPRGRGRAEAFRGVTVLKLYLVRERLMLSDFMPILDNAGLRVIEVTPFAVAGEELPEMMIYSFAVQGADGGAIAADRAGLLAEALLATRQGDTQNDLFNSLVLLAGLRWREVDVIRTYANYAFQAGLSPTRFAPARALARHPELARSIIELFRAKFDPAGPSTAGSDALDSALTYLRARINHGLDAVTTLSDDRPIRRLATLVEATMRTNYFRHGGADPTARSGGAPYISIKIRSGAVEELRRGSVLYEIFVFSSRMEGIHLRGSAVSRGGLRWSDRADDFRTEVLDLVQTQIVKNAVIVPGGSKGGFITKRASTEREAMLAAVADQYRTLIRGMLDLTDNLVDGEVAPPPGVVRFDGDDPYLVVAADKGTAHLSDVANEIAGEYGFWLGDAFASGGTHGYDHKKLGITARGAWECVKRHFGELGKDVQSEAFTVAGVGDMSGDVFGNGMLLSRQIRLIAAFDHRHVFIDPDPDLETSFRERERLFGMRRSTWDDYDRSALSAGAMIVPRASKEITLTPEARAALDIDPSVTALDGEGLVRAVLTAPVELLWNGGIGTYVKDADEMNAEVGDTANDPVRVDADQLRCQVIGEGGNLGLTQQARITFALRGGRLNTDALDNSAGVDMSDHEVNLKILLAPTVASGAQTFEERNRLLDGISGEVVDLVLTNTVQQSLAVSLDESRSREALSDFTALISSFERDRLLARTAVGIPASEELEERGRQGLGLTRPTLCVLLAYAKLHAHSVLLASGLPDEPAIEDYLIRYFPRPAVQAVGIEGIRRHRLRREIITTQVTNDLIDLMGASFLHRVSRDTGRPLEAVVAAWCVASGISGAAEIRADIAGLEGRFPSRTVYRWFFGLARVLERTTRWTLANVEPNARIERVIEDLRGGLTRLRSEFSHVVSGQDRLLFEERLRELQAIGVEGPLAERLITLRFLPELLDVLRIAREAESDPIETAQAYYGVADHLGIGWVQQALRATLRAEVWEKRLTQSLEADLRRAHRTVTRRVLACRAGEEPIADNIATFQEGRAGGIEQYAELLAELRTADTASLAGCAVAVRALLELAEG